MNPIKSFFHSGIKKADQKIGVPSDYLHYILDKSFSAFLRFMAFLPFADFRGGLPSDVWCVARMVAVRSADCGPCLQIVVNQALQEGVGVSVIQSVLDRKPEQLSPVLADVYQFTQHVVTHTYEEEPFRQKLRSHFNDRAMIALAFGISSVVVFPYMKKVLGYAQSCRKVEIKLPPR